MQRYRVNYRLLAGLVIGGILLAGGSTLLWMFQINRNASKLLARADAAEESGDTQEAFESLYQYTRLRQDELDARRRLSTVAVELANKNVPGTKEWADAYGVLAESVIRTDDKDIRRQLVDVQAKYGFFDLALANVEDLLAKGETDPDLKVLKARCLFVTQKQGEAAKWCYDLIGYDQKTDKFDKAKAQTPDKPMVYAMLASYLRQNDRPELARRVVDQMVEMNPKSSDAQLYRYEVMKGLDDKEEAAKSLAKAFEINPKDAGVLSAKGVEELNAYQTEMLDGNTKTDEEKEAGKKHLDEASRYFTEALEKYPDRVDFYERIARIAVFRQQTDEAFAMIDKGLTKFPLRTSVSADGFPLAVGLENMKLELLLSQNKLDAVEAELAAVDKLNNERLKPLTQYYNARIQAVHENWADAARELADVKERLLGFPDLQATASAIEGFCQQQLGQYDLAKEAYAWALTKNPYMVQAQAGKAEMERMIGQSDGNSVDTAKLEDLIKKEIALPQPQQDWDKLFTKIDEFIDAQAKGRDFAAEWVDARKQLVRAQSYAMRAEAETDAKEKAALYLEARDAVKQAYKLQPDDPIVQLAAVRLLMTEPGKGPDAALGLLDQIVAKTKDSAQFRIQRAEILAARNGKDVVADLNKVTEGIEDWTPGQQAAVWTAVGAQFERLGMVADAARCVARSAELSPGNLPTALALFNLALKQNDDAAMDAAQKQILAIVKRKDAPDYVLSDVKRRLIAYSKKEVSKEQMADAQKMLQRAIKERPTFADLYVARGQLALILDQNVEAALKDFDEALRRGQANYNAVALQVRLLSERGRAQEARERMNKMPEAMWAAVLGQAGANVLEQTGEVDKAISEAQKVADANPDDQAIQTWFGEMAARAKKADLAEAALQKAVEVNPSNPEAWTRLTSYYLQAEKYADVERVVREAHLALDEEFLPLLMGKYYELRSRWQEAEDIYKSAYSGNDDDLFVARRMAEFYLTWVGKDEGNRTKAAHYLNQILRAVNEGKLPADDATAIWARGRAARLLSESGDYGDSVKAEKLLASGTGKDGKLSTPEQLQLVEILDRRGGPEALQREIDIFRELSASGGLTPEQDLVYSRALLALEKPEAAEAVMKDAIGRYPNNAMLRVGYTTMLIEHGQFDAAKGWLARMNEIAGPKPDLTELQLRLIAAQGDKKQLRSALESMTPNLAAAISEAQLKGLGTLAGFADKLGDHEYALKLMREYARRTPGNELQLARMIALYGDIDEAIASLRRLMGDNIEAVTTMAVEMLRSRRADAPEKLDEELGRIVRAARRDDPESARYMVLEAEFLEIQEKYEESIAAYRAVLASADLPKLIRATASNNLAFILSLQKRDADEALAAVEDAIEVVGPISDILDTRGLAYMALGKYGEAAQDFSMSVKTEPTASKYFHLTQALLANNDERGALEAWQKAVAAGIAPEKVSKLEGASLAELTNKMKTLKPASAQL